MGSMSNNDTIKVSIEMGEGYRPTARIAAAVEELEAALHEAHGDEVSGFEFKLADVLVSSYTAKLDVSFTPTRGLSGSKALCTNEVIQSEFKF
jgi:hypothetical protein